MKVYMCLSSSVNTSKASTTTSMIGDSKGGDKGSSPGLEGVTNGIGKNPKLPQSVCVVKKVGGIRGLLDESRKVYIRAESDYGLVLYPAVKRNIEDSSTSASSIGEAWNGAHASSIEISSSSDTKLQVTIDNLGFEFHFEEGAIATVWNAYFQVNGNIPPLTFLIDLVFKV
jgi:hypothetical protein